MDSLLRAYDRGNTAVSRVQYDLLQFTDGHGTFYSVQIVLVPKDHLIALDSMERFNRRLVGWAAQGEDAGAVFPTTEDLAHSIAADVATVDAPERVEVHVSAASGGLTQTVSSIVQA